MAGKCRHSGLWAIGGLGLYALACLASRGFAAFALERLSRPAMAALHRLTAPMAFPLTEPLTLTLAVLAAASLLAAIVRTARRHDVAPLRRWARGTAGTALALLGMLALLWLPACGAGTEDLPPAPDAGRLSWLCGELIDALNDGLTAFPAPADSLKEAPSVAGLPGGAVKAVRYPEWMRGASISGLFVPLTGEALVDATAPAPLVPFTAVHELTHLRGVADEGAANVAAWEQCTRAGGAFRDSARLWALRYAMGMLREADADAWQAARAKMEGPLARVFHKIGGEITPSRRTLPGLPLFARARGDYAALVGYLAREGQPALKPGCN